MRHLSLKPLEGTLATTHCWFHSGSVFWRTVRVRRVNGGSSLWRLGRAVVSSARMKGSADSVLMSASGRLLARWKVNLTVYPGCLRSAAARMRGSLSTCGLYLSARDGRVVVAALGALAARAGAAFLRLGRLERLLVGRCSAGQHARCLALLCLGHAAALLLRGHGGRVLYVCSAGARGARLGLSAAHDRPLCGRQVARAHGDRAQSWGGCRRASSSVEGRGSRVEGRGCSAVQRSAVQAQHHTQRHTCSPACPRDGRAGLSNDGRLGKGLVLPVAVSPACFHPAHSSPLLPIDFAAPLYAAFEPLSAGRHGTRQPIKQPTSSRAAFAIYPSVFTCRKFRL